MENSTDHKQPVRLVLLYGANFEVGAAFRFEADGRAGLGLPDEKGYWRGAPWEAFENEDEKSVQVRLEYLRPEDAGRWRLTNILSFHGNCVLAEVVKA